MFEYCPSLIKLEVTRNIYLLILRIVSTYAAAGPPSTRPIHVHVTSLHSKRHLDRFIRFCRAHDRGQHTDRYTFLRTDMRSKSQRLAPRFYVVNVFKICLNVFIIKNVSINANSRENFTDVLRRLLRFFACQLHIQNRWTMQNSEIIIQEARTAIRFARMQDVTLFCLLPTFAKSPTLCIHLITLSRFKCLHFFSVSDFTSVSSITAGRRGGLIMFLAASLYNQ